MQLEHYGVNLNGKETGIYKVYIRITTKMYSGKRCQLSMFRKLNEQQYQIIMDTDLNVIVDTSDFNEETISKFKTFIIINKVKLENLWENGMKWMDLEFQEFCDTLKVSKVEFKQFGE